MSHTIKRAIIAVVIAAAVYFLSGPIIGYMASVLTAFEKL